MVLLRVLLVAPSTNPLTYKGLGRYCKELLAGLRRHAEVGFVQKIIEQDKVISTHSEIPLRLMLQQLSGNYDVVHALAPELGLYSPFLYNKSVVTFHDLIPIEAAADMSFRFQSMVEYYTRITWPVAARAKRIIANSTQTRDELIDILHADPRRIRVVPLGVDARFGPASRKRSKPQTVGFFGNYTYRKRVDVAVSAFKLLSQEFDAKLILAGGDIQTVYQRHFDMKRLIAGMKHVKLLGHVAEAKLPALYNSFDVMLFPSSYEGFGLPILEAQRCGVPVLILSDAKIPREVTKKCVICTDANDMAMKTLALLEHPRNGRRIGEAGIKYASKFTWEKTVNQTIEVYEELLKA
jgi:glycosyltransferase involved in cell wall biosynthesis